MQTALRKVIEQRVQTVRTLALTRGAWMTLSQTVQVALILLGQSHSPTLGETSRMIIPSPWQSPPPTHNLIRSDRVQWQMVRSGSLSVKGQVSPRTSRLISEMSSGPIRPLEGPPAGQLPLIM